MTEENVRRHRVSGKHGAGYACPAVVMIIAAVMCIMPGPQAAGGVAEHPVADATSQSRSKVAFPPAGKIYHGMHPGGDDGQEDIVIDKPSAWYDYEKAVGRRPAWVYFSQEWGYPDGDKTRPMNSHDFPLCIVRRIAERGQLPFIRLMLRTDNSSTAEQKPEDRESYFTLNNILGERPDDPEKSHQINEDLAKWGRDARAYGGPVIVEWGTEANGDTFFWNAKYNGPEGALLFRKTFRHIVRTVSGPDPSDSNITWVFHVVPEESEGQDRPDWSLMAQYYPDGTAEDPEDVVDWLGVSIYGAQDKTATECESFAGQLDRALNGAGDDGLLALAGRHDRKKPIFILEMGTAGNYAGDAQECRPEIWINGAFDTLKLKSEESPQRVWGFSWWNERYPGDDKKGTPVELRAQKSDVLARSLRDGITRAFVHNAPDVRLPPPDKSSCLRPR